VFSGNTYQPHVFSDGRGSVWVVAKTRTNIPVAGGPGQRGYWEYSLTRFEGKGWSQPIALPNSKGRSSTRVNAALTSGGGLALTWPTDDRLDNFYHRPQRQQIYAGVVPAPSEAPGAAAWKSSPDEAVEAKPGHASEAADLQAIRAYRAPIGASRTTSSAGISTVTLS
jgi:hypothetical protein